MNHSFPEPIAPELLRRAGQLDVAQICDGMKELGLEGCLCAQINAVHPSMKVAGTAATIETMEGDNFPIHVATYTAPQDGYVMVIDGKGYMDRAYLGDLIISAAKAVGYMGIVLDGCSRDYTGTVAAGLPVFSRGLMPAGPIKKGPGSINTPITCGGVPVEPGDLIVGDYDGVCVIPRNRIEEVLAKAEAKAAYEAKRVKTIQSYVQAKAEGKPLPQLAPQWVLDMLEQK